MRKYKVTIGWVSPLAALSVDMMMYSKSAMEIREMFLYGLSPVDFLSIERVQED